MANVRLISYEVRKLQFNMFLFSNCSKKNEGHVLLITYTNAFEAPFN